MQVLLLFIDRFEHLNGAFSATQADPAQILGAISDKHDSGIPDTRIHLDHIPHLNASHFIERQ